MTNERKAEVNRILAEFEDSDPCICGHPSEDHYDSVCCVVADCSGRCPAEIDYAAETNALARIEAKLPPHETRIYYYDDAVTVSMRFPLGSTNWHESPLKRTEAEARCEAVVQYLAARAVEKG